ncbi:MAG: YqgE/AlgH family protein [Puniceicoccaceae bacterium]
MVFNPDFVSSSLHSGQLLVATPDLKDSNFEKSVILLSAHAKDAGALGVVINKPLQHTLGEFVEEFRHGPLADVAIYLGGPVQQNQLILAGWQWSDCYQDFRLYFGMSQDKAVQLMQEGGPNVEIRGYLGYAGWSEGQLEEEIRHHAWFQAPVDPVCMLESSSPAEMWQTMVGRFHQGLDGLLKIPDDPSLN